MMTRMSSHDYTTRSIILTLLLIPRISGIIANTIKQMVTRICVRIQKEYVLASAISRILLHTAYRSRKPQLKFHSKIIQLMHWTQIRAILIMVGLSNSPRVVFLSKFLLEFVYHEECGWRLITQNDKIHNARWTKHSDFNERKEATR